MSGSGSDVGRDAPGRQAGARPVIAVAWPKPDYLESLALAGGEPRVLTPAQDVLPGALEGCDGLLLTGGEDVDPALYQAGERHPSVKVDRARDDYEIALTRAALDRGLPILAICRGVQVLNVVGGGTLVQDLPSEQPDALPHRPGGAADALAHEVIVTAGTTLERLLGERLDASQTMAVNSRHHQSVKEVAPGFRVSAVARDGVIEAIERPGHPFCVGVQWHPENFWRMGTFAELFRGFIAAAKAKAGPIA